jgi:hypothetical protein
MQFEWFLPHLPNHAPPYNRHLHPEKTLLLIIRVGPYREVGFKPPSARFFSPRKYLASSRGEGLRVGKATVGELVAQYGGSVKDKGRGHTNMLIV